MPRAPSPETRPIGLVFALAGLYLHVENLRIGREVQQTHMQMGNAKRTWPSIVLPEDRGAITAVSVLAVPVGAARDQAIHAWCRCVWEDYSANHPAIVALLESYRIR